MSMRKRKSLTHAVVVLFLGLSASLLCAAGACGAVAAQPQEQSTPIFSQGQAVLDPQDQAKTQQYAIQDFLVQGVSQAVGKFLSPTQMGVHFNDIQKKILSQPSKYIDSYQLFSQGENGSIFKVVGQITVAMDVLRKDLEAHGFPVANVTQRPEGPDAAEPVEDPLPPEEGQHAETPEEAEAEEEPAPVSSRGLAATKREVLWVVPEKWEQEWILPSDQREIRTLFARSMRQEFDSRDITILLPPSGAVKMDLAGNVPQSQVASLAEGLGLKDAVVGAVTYKLDRSSKQAFIEASLRVLRGGKPAGEVRKMQSVEELSNEEGALELASRVVQEVTVLLGSGSAGNRAAETGRRQESQPSEAAPGAGEGVPSGPWTLSFPSVQYPYWKAMERALRDQFKNMLISGLEMGSGEGVVKLANIDGGFVAKMNGTVLSNGAVVRVDSFSVESRTIKVSFSPPGKVQ